MLFRGFKVVKRQKPISGLEAFIYRFYVVLAGLMLISVIFMLNGVNPLRAYFHIVKGSIFSSSGFENTILHFIPLAIIGIGIAIPARAQIDNIGAEGQFVMGILGAYWVAFTFPNLVPVLLILMMFIVAAIVGALYALPIAAFRVYGKFKGADIVSGFLLVFPAISFLQYKINGSWRSQNSQGFPQSDQLSENAQLPKLGDFGVPFLEDVHITLVIALALIFLLNIVFFKIEKGVPKTKIAFEIKVVGKNETAARIAGINYPKVAFITTLVSGALAAIAGVGLLAGQDLRLRTSIARGYGFSGIVVAWLGGLSPVGILLSAFLVAMLFSSEASLQINLRLPSTVKDVLLGRLLISILVSQFFLKYSFARKVEQILESENLGENEE